MSDSTGQSNRHSQEPWCVNAFGGRWEVETDDRNCLVVADCASANNARRIVACVNGCAGINPEAVPELVNALQTIDTMPVDWVSPSVIESMLRQAKSMAYSAIAKAKGVANV